MKKVKFALSLIIVLILTVVVKAEVPAEDPFYSVGSDFLVMKYGQLSGSDPVEPQALILFNDTSIYLDNQNDGTWDYEFTGDAGNIITVDPAGVIEANSGGLLHSNKPIAFLQRFFSYYFQQYKGSGYDCWKRYSKHHNTFVPTISNLKKEYYIYPDTWKIVSNYDGVINFDYGFDSIVNQTLSISKGQVKTFDVPAISRVDSDIPFLIFNEYTIGGLVSDDFFATNPDIKILVSSDNTNIFIDENNDDAYDYTYNLNRGSYTYSVSYGAHIWSDQPISLFSKIESTGQYPTSYINNLPASHIGSDLYVYNPQGSDTIGLFDQYSGINEKTTYFLDTLTSNDLIYEYNYTVFANTLGTSVDKTHLWADMPLISHYYYREYFNHIYCAKALQDYVNYMPFSRIYATSWPVNKIIGTNELTGMNVRAFDPFATTTASGVEVKIKVPDSFTIPGGFSVNVQKKSLVDDSGIASTTTPESPSHVGDYYEFVLDFSDDVFIGVLSPLEYLDIEYSVVSPGFFSNFDFPVELSYVAPTWQK